MSTLEKIINAEQTAKQLVDSAKAEVEKIKRDSATTISNLQNDAHQKRQKLSKELNEATLEKQQTIDAKFAEERIEIAKKIKNDVNSKQQKLVTAVVKDLTK